MKEQVCCWKHCLWCLKKRPPIFACKCASQPSQCTHKCLYRKADSVLLCLLLQWKWIFLIVCIDMFWRWNSGISGFENLSQLIIVWEVSQYVSPFKKLNYILGQLIVLLKSQKKLIQMLFQNPAHYFMPAFAFKHLISAFELLHT